MEPGPPNEAMEQREDLLVDHKKALKESVFTGLKDMYFSESLCDVTIQAEGDRFLCHRVVLASVSPYFRALFMSPMKEAELGEVCLSDVPSSVLQLILHYIYTGEVDLTMDNVEELFIVSGRLQITAMQDSCSRYLAMRIDNENCLWIYSLAHSHNQRILLEETMNHIVWNLNSLSKREDFFHLEMEELVNILSSDDLMFSSELAVYDLARCWWEFHTQRDELLPPELLKAIRVPLLTPDELEKVSRDIPSNDSPLQPPTGIRLRQGMFEERIVCLDSRSFDTAGPEETFHFNAYDPTTESWERLPFCGRFEQTGIVAVGCNLYVSGGYREEGSPSNALHVYDSLLNEWKELPPMTHPRASHGFLAYRNVLYAFGGCNNNELTDSVECFNVLDNSWRDLSSMPKALHSFASAVLKGRLFAIGGMARKDIDPMHYPGFHIYDILTDTWGQFPLPMVFSAAGAVTLRDKVYIIATCKPRHDDLNAYPAYDANSPYEDYEAYLMYNEEPNTICRSFCMDHLGRICHSRIPPVLESTSYSAIIRWMHRIYILGGSDAHYMSIFGIFYWSPGEPRWTLCKKDVPFLITDFGHDTLRVPLKHLSPLISGRRLNYQFRRDLGMKNYEVGGRESCGRGLF
ncbi:kelch repeat and BTB domain-containing protein 8-like [Aquarana catesbeiana]|uniref:kelch repeat and BTB domain-containing protein 8-like n=1 Tax=Aquarana catesbeiana TaxID=8400 RepID=UPI003CC9BEB7